MVSIIVIVRYYPLSRFDICFLLSGCLSLFVVADVPGGGRLFLFSRGGVAGGAEEEEQEQEDSVS